MPEALNNIKQKIVNFWSGLDKSQKIRLYITSGIILIAIVAIVILLTRTNYVPLFSSQDTSGLNMKDVSKTLDDNGVRYKPGDNGEILVDARDKNKAEFLLATSGLTDSNITFENAWNMIKMTSTESDKKQLWENYKKNTLIAKLKMFDNVADADVDLTMPEQSSFVVDSNGENKEATAFVKIKPKGEITPDQVNGIVAVVASSIEGLPKKNVTVVDNNFNILNSNSEDLSSETSTQYKMRLKIKNLMESDIKNLFSGQFDNFDNIRAVANPYLDFNKSSSTSNTITKPDGMDDGAKTQYEQTNEKLNNGAAGGVPGVNSNGNNGATSYQTNGNNNSSYTKSSVKYSQKYNEVLTTEEKALGQVVPEKSTMTVIIGYGQRVTQDNITNQFTDQLKSDISGATGIPVANISVSKYKLAPAEVTKTTFGEALKEFFNQYGFFILMLMLTVALIVALFPKKKKNIEPQPQLAFAEMAAAEQPGNFVKPEAPTEYIPEIDTEEKSEVKKKIEKFVKQKPDAVAQLLRNWLADDWD